MSGEWLVAVCLFWFASAVYFGGFERDVQGATGFRNFVGLMLSYAIFLVVWGVLHAYVAPESAQGILIASAGIDSRQGPTQREGRRDVAPGAGHHGLGGERVLEVQLQPKIASGCDRPVNL